MMRLAFVLLLVAACTPGSTSDDDDMAPPDAGGCEPRSALPAGWTPVAKVSAGAVTSTAQSGATVSTIDATAGGFGASANEPFVYVKLGNGTLDKVAIDDAQ